jgi:hypothetical protein
MALPLEPDQPKLSSLAFLAGSWRTSGEVVTEEHWLAPEGGTMLGVSRTVRGEKTVFEEYLRIEERDGEVRMAVAMGLGAKPINFRAADLGSSQVKFVSIDDPNEATIVYQRNGERLVAVVEGKREGKPYRLEFSFTRK